MTNTGHRLTGIGAAMLSAAIAHLSGGHVLLAAVAALPGATAPDWLEWAKRDTLGSRTSVIPHRTLTHWLPVWVAAAYVGVAHVASLYASVLLGFSVGGLLHLAVDIPNPMGIPLWVPWKRVSLGLWRCGEYEVLLVILSWMLGIFAIAIAYYLN